MKIRVLNQKTGSFQKNKIKIGEKLRNLKNCPDNRWGFDGAISNTHPPRDQNLYGIVLSHKEVSVSTHLLHFMQPNSNHLFVPHLFHSFNRAKTYVEVHKYYYYMQILINYRVTMFMVHHVVIWIFYKLNVLMQTFFYGCQ
jgi:hypothetical protein